jgi:hypothetical protein
MTICKTAYLQSRILDRANNKTPLSTMSSNQLNALAFWKKSIDTEIAQFSEQSPESNDAITERTSS